MGVPLTGPLGDYGLCWNRSASAPYPGGSPELQLVGTLTLAGPEPADYACTASMPCVVQLAGVGLQPENRLLLVADAPCGDPAARAISLFGLINPQMPLAVNGVITGEYFPMGIVEAAVPNTTYALCWSSVAGAADTFVVSVDGDFILLGPHPLGVTTECIASLPCEVSLKGFGLASTNELLIAEFGTCGMFAMPIGWAGLTNPQQPSSPANTTYAFGTTAVVANFMTYVLCWAHSPATEGTGHPVEVGYLTLSGPFTATATCTLGQPCSVQLSGYGFGSSSALLLRLPSEDCSNAGSIGAATWGGLANPQLASNADHMRYDLGAAVSGGAGQGYLMCWTANASGNGQILATDASFIVPVGSFSMVGPSPPADALGCYLAAPCTVALPGYGFTGTSSVRIYYGIADCGQGGSLAVVADLVNPATAGPSSPSDFHMGMVEPDENNSAVTNYTLCWDALPGGPHVIFAGRFAIQGPYRHSGLSCTLGEPCELRLAGLGLYDSTRRTAVTLVNGAGMCGDPSVYAALWTASAAALVEPVEDAPFGDVGVARFGLPTRGTVVTAYSLCWRHELSATLYEYRTTVDPDFELHGPVLSMVVTCTLGRPCQLQLDGVSLASTNGVALVDGGSSCGENETALAPVFAWTNPAAPNSSDATHKLYTLGNESSADPGHHRMCWAHNPASSGLEHFRVHLGQLTLEGPYKANYTCIMGANCIVNLTGRGLSTNNRLAVVSFDTVCGASDPTFVTFGGLPAPNPMAPQSPGSIYDMGRILNGTPQVLRLCWSSQPLDIEGHAAFRVEVGTLFMKGPYVGPLQECQICKKCKLRVAGLGVETSNRILMIKSSGTCGDAAQMQSLQLYASHAGLQNPPALRTLEGGTLMYNVGTPTVGVPGSYTICWGHNPQSVKDYAVPVGVFILTPAETVPYAGTTLGGAVLLEPGTDYMTANTSDFRTSVLGGEHEAASAIDNDTATGWFSEVGSCASSVDEPCAALLTACRDVDPSACSGALCSAEPWIVFDLLAERLVCKLQIVNGLLGDNATHGVRSLVVEVAGTLQGPWTSPQTLGPLPPACAAGSELADVELPESAAGRYLRLRVLESWGASSVGLLEVLVWASPWELSQNAVDPSRPVMAPGPPFWAATGGRAGMAFVALPGSLTVLILGGADAFGNLHNDVHRSVDGGITWEVILWAAPWSVRRGHAAAVEWSSGKVVLLGGLSWHSAVARARSDAWLSPDAGMTWVRQSDNQWRPRYEHAAVFDMTGKLYLSGGLTCSRQTGACGSQIDRANSDVWMSPDAGVSWSEVPPAAGRPRWSARHAFSLVAERSGGGGLIIIGGRASFGIPLQDVWRSTDGGATWSPQALSAEFPARAFHMAAMAPDDTAIYTLGGQDSNGSALNDVWVSTDRGQSWSQRAPFPGRRHSFGVVVDAGGGLVILGGVPYTSSVMTAACIS